MVIAGFIIVAAATLSWLAVRRCPLARAVGRQIDHVASGSR
jgi:hypothetical protein